MARPPVRAHSRRRRRFAALPAFAAPPGERVRNTGRARDAATPVLL